MRSPSPTIALCFTLLACRGERPAAAPGHASGALAAEEPTVYEGEDPGWSLTTVPTASPALAASGGDALVTEAVRELRAMQRTRYRHRTRVDEAIGTFEFDCSGFVAYALANAIPAALARVPLGPKGRPRAEDFTAFFAALGDDDPAWQRVARGDDVAPGDVVAWLRPAEVTNTNTGHMAIVLDRVGLTPTSSSSAALSGIGGARELLLRVADSTESPHSDDARGEETTTGLGTGVIGLVVDGSDAPIGYRWRGGKSPKAYATLIAVARPR